MKRRLSILIVVFMVLLGLHAPSHHTLAELDSPVLDPQVIVSEDSPIPSWEIRVGDWIVADVINNTLQFVRADSSEVSPLTPIASGINNGRPITYLGMTYKPATPKKTWEIRSAHQQNRWQIFGTKEAKEQLFLRLYDMTSGTPRFTHYGIHTIPNIDTMLTANDGFNSWGCLVTRYDLLKKIEALFELNGGVIKVVTTDDNALQYLASGQNGI
ncbi:MAG: hypothetical protein Q8P95_00995 [bacterium]|nr:hypothetical protein [bacterium]